MTCFKVLSHNLLRGTEENNENLLGYPISGQYLNPDPPEFEALLRSVTLDGGE